MLLSCGQEGNSDPVIGRAIKRNLFSSPSSSLLIFYTSCLQFATPYFRSFPGNGMPHLVIWGPGAVKIISAVLLLVFLAGNTEAVPIPLSAKGCWRVDPGWPRERAGPSAAVYAHPWSVCAAWRFHPARLGATLARTRATT